MPPPLLTLPSLCLAEVAQVIFFVLVGRGRRQEAAGLGQPSPGLSWPVSDELLRAWQHPASWSHWVFQKPPQLSHRDQNTALFPGVVHTAPGRAMSHLQGVNS